MGEGAQSTWRLVSGSPLPAWQLGLLALLLVASLGLSWRSLAREARRSRRAALLGLRLGALACLLFLLFEPAVRKVQTLRNRNRVPVLLDRSASMGLPVRLGGPTRAAQAAELFSGQAAGWKALSESFVLEPATFDGELHPTDLASLGGEPTLAPDGTTDLAGVLRSAAAGGGGKPLSGMVVVTDGTDHGEWETGLDAKSREALQQLGVPISVVQVGEGGLPDLAIERVVVDDFAFVRNSVTVKVDVRARGFEGRTVPVLLSREGRTLATQPLTIDPARPVQTVTFTFAPDETGQFVHTVSVPLQAGEAVAENNAHAFVVKVIRDRMRVLFVVGRPSWDERFLRQLLREDQNVDLVSFFILRTPLDDAHVIRQEELSLIPFPVREIFDAQLKSFDVVLLLNFAHADRSYQMEQYLPGMRDYVAAGGALAMVGGDNSFGEGRYEATPIGELLPVEPTGAPPHIQPERAQLTPQGLRHPVTQLVADASENARLHLGLPPLEGIHATRPKEGAQVLVASESGLPVVTLGEFGRGRVMAVTTDSLWRWTLPAAAQGTPPRAFERLWSRALHWLVRDPDLTTLRVRVDAASVAPGKPVAATVQLRTPDYAPAVQKPVEVALYDVGQGNPVALQKRTLTTDAEGNARFEAGVLPPGAYQLRAKAQVGAAENEASDAVAVRASGPERADAEPRPKLLQALAEATGGRYVTLPTSSMPEFPLKPPEVVEVGSSRDEPIWDSALSLLLLVAFAGTEWALRRRWGLL